MVIGGVGLPLAGWMFDLTLYGGVVIGAILALGAMLVLMRRHLHGQRPAGADDFSVEQVERLHRQGTISDEEFAVLRRQALGLGAARTEDHNDVIDGVKDVDKDTEQGQG